MGYMTRKKKRLIFASFFIFVLALVLGTSYALWQITLTQTNKNTITTGCFKIDFKEKNDIELLDALPITNDDAKKLVPYEFTLTNTCNSYAGYQINLEILNDSTLEKLEHIDVMLNENEPMPLTKNDVVDVTLDNASASYKLDTGRINASEERTFYLRLWLGEDTPASDDVMNKTLNSKITITLTHNEGYSDSVLNGADPVLKEGLVPVTIASNGDVTRANIKEKWYDYENKEWANAVILKDETIEYAEGELVPESNIESYFVWIPRYRYKIFNDTKYTGLTDIDNTKVQTIEIEFESKYTTPSTGSRKDEWLTHPAFTSFNSNGMWVGKFETSKSTQTLDNSRSSESVQIKPNVTSWRNIQIGNAFYTSYYYQRQLDSHLMKNSEWGAVAYLQHSKYGSNASVRINNNSNYITGYASVKEPTCGATGDNRECNKYGTTTDITLPYNTTTGYLASTTGNITGIYDMSGGAVEAVMGVMVDGNGNPLSGYTASSNSGFIGGYGEGGNLASGYSWPSEKYYEKYAYGTSYTEYSRGILGDATVEMGPFRSFVYGNNLVRYENSWYGDGAMFITNIYPFFHRGGTILQGTESGIFSFGYAEGFVRDFLGFRIVLVP